VISLKERAQIERRAGFAIRHRRDGAIMHTIDLPRHNCWGGFAPRTPLALRAARSGRASITGLAARRQHLPAITGTQAWIVAPSDEGSTDSGQSINLRHTHPDFPGASCGTMWTQSPRDILVDTVIPLFSAPMIGACWLGLFLMFSGVPGPPRCRRRRSRSS